MSTTIDQRVVEMKFDNRDFERNTRQTMSTLDKLKEKLNLSGASRGLENLNTSANKVNMGGLANAVDTVRSKFSALEVVGITALANITNSVTNAAKKMVHELTVAPKMDGWKEYELTMNTIQTIMNSTGASADDVKKKLSTLDDYADKTVYSTADMFNNIYKFTNAGIDLDTATKAMIGIANATADAGQGAQQASMAYYNLAQSLSTGYLTTIDYKSLNLANIVTKDMKQAFADTAIAAGTLKKKGDGLYQAGKKTYNLQQLFSEGLSEQWATADVIMKVFGEYGDETTKLGQRAYKAATEVKTYTAMMESLKATAGTGWKRTWELIFGDLEPAKKFWTSVNEFIGGIIEGMADFRNGILEGALGKSFKTMSQNLSNVIKPVKDAVDSVSKATEKLKDVNKLATEVIRGNWGNGEKRLKELTKAGYNYYAVQNKVNEKLGNSFRYSDKIVKSQDELLKSQNKQVEAEQDLTKAQALTLEQLAEMSDAQLKDLKLKDEEIKALKDLKKYSDMTGLSMQEFLDKSGEIDGRWLIINSFKNLGKVIVETAKIFKQAWNDIFYPNKTDDQIMAARSEMLFKIIAAVHKLTTHLPKLRDANGKLTETGKKLLRTLKGVVAILDIFLTLTGGAFKIVLNVVKAILKTFNMDILDFTAAIGDAAVKLRDWIDNNIIFGAIIKTIVPAIKAIVVATKNWIKNNETINNGIKMFKDSLKSMTSGFNEWFKGLKETDNIPKYILEGLVNGLKKGVTFVVTGIVYVAKALIEAFQKILGIHSPSTVFEEMGGNILQGLLNGLKNGDNIVFKAIRTIGEQIVSIFKSIDFTDLVLVGGIVALTKAFKMLGGILTSVVSPLQGVANVLNSTARMMNNFGGMFEDFGKAKKTKALSKLITSVAILVGVLAIAVYKLSDIEPDRLKAAIFAIGALSAIVVALAFAMSKIGGVDLKAKTALTVIAISASLFIMTSVIKNLADIPVDRMGSIVLGLIAIIVGIGALLKMIDLTFKGENVGKVGAIVKTLMGISVALLIMTAVFKLMSILKLEEIGKGILFIGGFLVFIAILVKITQIGKDSTMAKVGGTLLAISTAMLLMVGVIKLFSMLTLGEVLKGIAFMGMFMIFIKILMSVTTVGNGASVAKVGATILAISTAMLLLSFVIKIIGSMDLGALAKGVIGITLLSTIVVILINIVRSASHDAPKIAGTILAISVAIGILGLTTLLLSKMNIGGLTKGIVAVGLLGALMMALAKTTQGGGRVAGGLIGMAGAIAILTISLALLSRIEFSKLAGAILALGAIVTMMIILSKATRNVAQSVKTVVILAAVVGGLAIVLALLAKLPVKQTLGAAAALTLLIVSLSTMLLVISKTGGLNAKALLGIAGILALVGMLYLIVNVLSKMQNVQNASQNATVLAAFIGVLAIVQLLCAAAGAIYTATGGMAALGLVGILALIGSLYLIIGALQLMSKVENAMTNLEALSDFMKLLTEILIKLAIVGPFAMMGVTALAALTLLMGAIGTFATAVGALMTKFPALEKFLDTGLSTMIKLAGGIGEMIGAFVKGALVKMVTSLPVIGMNLSMFMMNATPFIIGAKLVDSKVLAAVGILTGAIIALTAADLINGVVSFMSMGSSFADLGTELSQFMTNALPFLATAMTINPDIIQGIKALAETILLLTAADLLDGIHIFSQTPLEKFSEQLPILATGLKGFVNNLGSLTEDQVKTAVNAANIVKTLAQAAKEIPNSGGLLGSLVGENDMDSWSKQLPVMAQGIAGFIKVMTDNGIAEGGVKIANTAADIIKTLATVAKEIPNTGGLLADLIGDNDLATFATGLPTVGTGIAGFIKTLRDAGLSQDDVSVATTAAEVVKSLATAAKEVPNTGGLLAELVGDNDLSKFATKLPEVGAGVAGFVSNLGEFKDDKLATVKAATEAVKVIANMSKNYDKGDDKKDFSSFGKGMVTLAEKIKEFVENMAKVSSSTLDISIDKIKKLLDFSSTISGSNADSLKKFGESLKKFAKDGVKGFVDEISSKTSKNDAGKAAGKLVKAAIDGADDKKSDLKKKFKSIAEAGVDELDKKAITDDAKTAGKNLVIGFANGIKNNQYLATNASSALGKAALNAAKESLKEHSPSREAMEIGNYFGEGLVIGIKDYESTTYDAGYSIADRAKSGLSKAISKVSNLISSGIDDQPTIRPVLDLSDVENGASYLNSMFNNGPSIGVASNLSAISSGMNSRIQNGTNNDVISAINNLRKDLGNVGGNTYNINGITYDDGSNITNAVKDLIRAAQVERRI